MKHSTGLAIMATTVVLSLLIVATTLVMILGDLKEKREKSAFGDVLPIDRIKRDASLVSGSNITELGKLKADPKKIYWELTPFKFVEPVEEEYTDENP